MPVSGPNEYSAQLAYDVAPVGTHAAELRVDSKTVWLPVRSTGELAPAGGIAEVTWFSRVSYAQGSSGPVTVRLSHAQATALREVLDALPLGPAADCMEDSLLYRVVFHPTSAAASSFEADGYACARSVVITAHGRTMPSLYDSGCSLLRAVIELIPARQTSGTRAFSC